MQISRPRTAPATGASRFPASLGAEPRSGGVFRCGEALAGSPR